MILWVLGPPGVGKTTLVRQLLEPESYFVTKPKWTVGEKVCAAGHYTGTTFDGADTVPYNGVEQALTFWNAELKGKSLTIFDGDRFSHEKAKVFFATSGHAIAAIHLSADAEKLQSRRNARGSNQNATWLKGRQTKAEKFFATFDTQLSVETAALDPKKVFAKVQHWLAR